jgi:diguanylate cyclase (GGDEF)-like protein
LSPAPPRILVADDDAAAGLLMQAALEQAGFTVVLAASGEEALERFHADQISMVMLDVEMPGASGYDVCEVIRLSAGDLLPIVMVTGAHDVESVERAYRAGATDFIGKPITWPVLGHRARYLMRAYETALQLRSAETGLEAVLAALPDLLFEIDRDGNYIDVHSQPAGSVACLTANCIGRNIADVLPAPAAEACMEAVRDAECRGHSTAKHCRIPSADTVHWFELSVSLKTGANGTMATFLVLARDITEQHVSEDRIRRLAFFDTLTGLPNREWFRGQVTRTLKAAARQRAKVGLLCIDLDNFKRINDTLGHSVGDELLKMVAVRLRESLRTGDRVASRLLATAAEPSLARLGGDEFMVVLPGLTDLEDAGAVAQRVVKAISAPITLAQHEVMVTPSVGIAVYPDHGADQETLSKNSDLAMYFAKRQGAGGYAYFDTDMTAGALQRLTTEEKLGSAAGNDEFSLVFQPQFDLRNGMVSGMEALLRWYNEELGQVPPAEFVRVAEETGLILSVGEWALRAACQHAAAWVAEGLPPVRVAVNVSGLQLTRPDFPATVKNVLRETGLAPARLELEITESVVMQCGGRAESVLRELKAIGVQIAIDDFGTGYSSLGRLRDFPIDRLKIDRSFIQRIETSADDRAIGSAIIAMAKTLHLGVVAEGVEDFAQLAFLREEHCHEAQGYLLSKPLAPDDAVTLLRRLAAGPPDASVTFRLSRLIA